MRLNDKIDTLHQFDFRLAIRDHTGLRKQFFWAISKRTSLDVATLAQDTLCALGRWLHDDAQRAHRYLDGYVACLDAHKAFHFEAARVAQAINDTADSHDAERMFAIGSDYSKASIELGVAITRLMKARI